MSQKFTGGELTWNLATKTFTSTPAELADNLTGLEVPTDPTTLINLAWRTTGGLGGPLGARQGPQSTIGDNGAAQGYAGGKIFYSPETGAHAVTGAILSKYESLGGASGDLGYPVGTESDGGVPNSRISSFSAPDAPVIFWTPDTGAIVVRGAISAAWDKLGGATGTLGAPTGEQSVSGDTVTQTFSGGEISWNQATKEFSTTPADLASSLSGLELPDAVAQTPATSASGDSAEKSGWRSWWLLLIPVVLLLGSLAVWALRKSGSADADSDDHWPGSPVDSGRDGGYSWSSSGAGAESTFDSDEDAIDTAPTRIPTEAELAEFEQAEAFDGDAQAWEDDVAADSGRHAGFGGAEAGVWKLDLDETGWPRHRRAAPEPPTEGAFGGLDEQSWTGYEFDDEVVVDVESEIIEVESVQATADEPWRPAIHLPLSDPYQAPEGYWIKGNTHSGLYYTPDSELYDNTLPEVWFASEDMAQANGFVKAPE